MRERLVGKKKISTHTFAFLCVLCALCGLIFLSCPNSPQVPLGKGALTLNITGFQRTIIPIENFDLSKIESYKLEFTCTSEPSIIVAPVTRTKSNIYSSPVYLDEGDYDLAVTAYLETGQSKPVASGTAAFEIKEGEKISVPVTLTVLQDGTGTFSWDITYPSGLDYGNIKATYTDNSITLNHSFNVIDHINDTDQASLNSGYYSVLVTLSKTGASDIKRREILHIYNSMISHYEYTFLDAHFNMNIYTVTFDFKGADGVSGTMLQSVFHGELLQKPADPKKTGHKFDGWFTLDGSTSGNWGDEWNFATGKVESNGITLYAKWEALPTLGIGTDIDYEDDIAVTVTGTTMTAKNEIVIFKNTDGSISPATVNLSVSNMGTYDTGSIKWLYGTNYDTSNFYEISSASTIVQTLGTKIITVTATKDGKPYSATVFVVVQEL